MRVYLSSTLNDLGPERQAVKEALSGFCTVVESYDAADASVLQKCIDDVRSCDVYIGLVGLRYGFTPRGKSKSITELEFDAATEAGRRRLVFLKQPAAVSATMADPGWQDPASPIQAFRKQLDESITPRLFDSPDELKTMVVRSLALGGQPLGSQQVPADLAPEGGTELERMLSRCLNERWDKLGACRTLTEASIFSAQPAPLSARKVFASVAETDPDRFLLKMHGFVGKRSSGSSIAELARNPDLLEVVLLLSLVAAERYVRSKQDQFVLKEDEPVGGRDPRVAAVLAAACYGFGIRLSASRREPDNFVRLSADEFGYEQGSALVRSELYGAYKRLRLERDTLDPEPPEDSLLSVFLDTLREEMGYSLVVVTHAGSRLKDASLRASVFGELRVPIVFEGVPREEVKKMINNLKTLISPLLDGTLGELPSEEN